VVSTTNTGGSFYQYVDMSGNVQRVYASSASVALATAYNRSPSSGVMLVTQSTSIK